MPDKNKVVFTVSALVLTGTLLVGMPTFDTPLAIFGLLFVLGGIAYLYQMLPPDFEPSTAFSQWKLSTVNFTLPQRRWLK